MKVIRRKKSGYSKKFLEEHREDITLHKAAKAAFNQLEKKAAGSPDPKRKEKYKISTIKQLNQEYAEVLSGKKKAYADYRSARKEMQDYLIARKNIEAILGTDQKQEEQEKEKLQEQQKNQNR